MSSEFNFRCPLYILVHVHVNYKSKQQAIHVYTTSRSMWFQLCGKEHMVAVIVCCTKPFLCKHTQTSHLCSATIQAVFKLNKHLVENLLMTFDCRPLNRSLCKHINALVIFFQAVAEGAYIITMDAEQVWNCYSGAPLMRTPWGPCQMSRIPQDQF